MGLFAQPAIQDRTVGIDAAIAEKRPVAASVFALCGIAFDDKDFFFVVGGFGGDLAEGIGDERISPEFKAGVAVGGLTFEADAIDDGDVDAIGDSVSTLNGFPGIELRCAELGFFVGMPADAGGIENDLRSAEGGDAGALGIPLIPANLHADFAVVRLEIRETEITGREIKFFVVERIVWDVHFAIFAEEAAVGVENGAGVVVDAGGAALEKRNDKNDFFLFRYFGEGVGCGTGNRFGKIEKIGIFLAAEIFAPKQLMQ